MDRRKTAARALRNGLLTAGLVLVFLAGLAVALWLHVL